MSNRLARYHIQSPRCSFTRSYIECFKAVPLVLVYCLVAADVGDSWYAISSRDTLWIPHIAGINALRRRPRISAHNKSGYAAFMRQSLQLKRQAAIEQQLHADSMQLKARFEKYVWACQTHFHDVSIFAFLLLFNVFLGMRLDNVVRWNWHLVALPLYVSLAVRQSF